MSKLNRFNRMFQLTWWTIWTIDIYSFYIWFFHVDVVNNYFGVNKWIFIFHLIWLLAINSTWSFWTTWFVRVFFIKSWRFFWNKSWTLFFCFWFFLNRWNVIYWRSRFYIIDLRSRFYIVDLRSRFDLNHNSFRSFFIFIYNFTWRFFS